jgi:hypothetical protein
MVVKKVAAEQVVAPDRNRAQLSHAACCTFKDFFCAGKPSLLSWCVLR